MAAKRLRRAQSRGPGGVGCLGGESNYGSALVGVDVVQGVALYLITVPAVVVIMYLIFRKRGP